MTQVPWWKRLLLAFLATLIIHLLNTFAFTLMMFYRPGELDAHPFRSEAQTAGLFLILGGYFVLGAFFLIGAPLALFVPVRFQLRHWYGMLLAAGLLPLLLNSALGAHDVPTFWNKASSYKSVGGYTALCGVLTCSLYLWRLHRAAATAPGADLTRR